MNTSFLKITIFLTTLLTNFTCLCMKNSNNPYKMYRDPVIENMESNPKLIKKFLGDVLNRRFDRIPYFCEQNRCYLYNFLIHLIARSNLILSRKRTTILK